MNCETKNYRRQKWTLFVGISGRRRRTMSAWWRCLACVHFKVLQITPSVYDVFLLFIRLPATSRDMRAHQTSMNYFRSASVKFRFREFCRYEWMFYHYRFGRYFEAPGSYDPTKYWHSNSRHTQSDSRISCSSLSIERLRCTLLDYYSSQDSFLPKQNSMHAHMFNSQLHFLSLVSRDLAVYK